MEIFFAIIIILVASGILTIIAKKLKMPIEFALLILGILFALPILNNAILQGNQNTLTILGEIGLFALMFQTGLESSWSKLKKEEKDATTIALYSAIFSFALGFIVFMILGFGPVTSTIIGTLMSITAEGSKARLLIEINKLKTKVGSAMLDAGIIDDIIGITLFIITAYLFGNAAIEQFAIISGAILAFAVGVVAHSFMGRKHKTIRTIEKISLYFLVPFFFVSIGAHFHYANVAFSPLLILIIIFTGFLGKITGVHLTKHKTNFSHKQLHLIGWAMNSRGALEIVLALIAVRSGLINGEIYTGFIILALLSTLIFPFIVKQMIKKNKRIMY